MFEVGFQSLMPVFFFFFFTSIWLSADVLPHTSSKASFWAPLFFYSCFSKWIEPYQNAFIERCAYSIAVSIIWQFLHYSTITKSLVGIIQQCSVIWESFSAGKYSLSFKLDEFYFNRCILFLRHSIV